MTFEHSEQALAIRRETGCNLDRFAEDMEWAGVSVGPCGVHRDSDALERSNFATAQTLLDEVDSAGWAVARFNHWAVGWIDEIFYDTGNDRMSVAVSDIRSRLDDYPVLDEDDYSQREWAENHPSDGVCYSESPDCPCTFEEAEE